MYQTCLCILTCLCESYCNLRELFYLNVNSCQLFKEMTAYSIFKYICLMLILVYSKISEEDNRILETALHSKPKRWKSKIFIYMLPLLFYYCLSAITFPFLNDVIYISIVYIFSIYHQLN